MTVDRDGAVNRALAEVRRRCSQPDEGAALVAFLLATDREGPSVVDEWVRVTGQRAGDFDRFRRVGAGWQSGPTPHLVSLVDSDQAEAVAYATSMAELASAAAARLPIDLHRLNAAAFVAAAQLRATAPEHGLMPPPSVVPLRAALQHGADPGGAGVAGSAGGVEAETEGHLVGIRVEPDVAPTPEPMPEPESYQDVLRELDALIGLGRVKEEVRQQAELLRVGMLRDKEGLRNPDVSRHLIFTGNPGTGKTTVARLVARLYRSLGILDQGHLVEVDRSGLVGGYLGQTEARTAEVVQKALGGVLFVDEAYALAGDQYGDAAVATLVKAIEDHRGDLVLIVAGYPDRMIEFLDTNPGLESRLRLTIFFPDYSEDELVEIFTRLCRSSDYEPTDDALAGLRTLVQLEPRDESFGNARFVRNCFEAAIVRQAWRLREIPEPTSAQLRELTADDLAAAPGGA